MTKHRARGPHSIDIPPRAPILDSYLGSIDKGELIPDPHQHEVIESLQSIADELLSTRRASTPSGVGKKSLRNFFGIGKPAARESVEPVRGLYVWGGVGRGKTHLVDLFFENLPINEKLRLHFHRFMVLVHRELRQHANIQDPLEIVAEEFARENRLLCLDEIHVHDITDAMLLGELFRHLFHRGVTLITTSNVRPDGLYHNGLQRQRFLPAIALLEQHTRVLHVGGDMDYRTRALEQAGTYHLIRDGLADEKLRKEFHVLTGIERHHGARSLMVNNRELPVVMWDDGIAWFTFTQLCDAPRSTDDYIQIAEYFHTVMVSGVPIMGTLQDDAARRFVNMIDEFYDRSVNLVVSAETEPPNLYTGKRLAFEFERTASRLQEMQSHEYIAREHLKAG